MIGGEFDDVEQAGSGDNDFVEGFAALQERKSAMIVKSRIPTSMSSASVTKGPVVTKIKGTIKSLFRMRHFNRERVPSSPCQSKHIIAQDYNLRVLENPDGPIRTPVLRWSS